MRLSLHECKRQAELAEAQNIADFYRAAPPDFAEEHGLHLEEASSYVATFAKNTEDFGIYNSILALGVARQATETELDHLTDLYRKANLPFGIRLSPEAQPTELSKWVEERGFKRITNSARFFLQVEESAGIPHHFQILPVDAKHVSHFVNIACMGKSDALKKWLTATIGRAGWHHYLVLEKEEPVATGVLYIQGEIGWLGWAVTHPSHRRKGVQSALLAHRIQEAKRLGCTLLSAETREDTPANPNPSYHNLLRAGFQFAYLRRQYIYHSFPSQRLTSRRESLEKGNTML